MPSPLEPTRNGKAPWPREAHFVHHAPRGQGPLPLRSARLNVTNRRNSAPKLMPFAFDITHLVTFLSGTAVGAAGTYMADRFTDRRREQESRKTLDQKYEALRSLMPEFFAEIRNDLAETADLAAREFVVLPSPNAIFNHEKPRLEYYETNYPAIRNWIDMLEEASFVSRIDRDVAGAVSPRPFETVLAPIFRLNEVFIARLKVYDQTSVERTQNGIAAPCSHGHDAHHRNSVAGRSPRTLSGSNLKT